MGCSWVRCYGSALVSGITSFGLALWFDSARLSRLARKAQQAAEQAMDRMARLQAITTALSEALTPAEVAEVILYQGVAAMGAAAAVVVLLEDDDRTLRITGSVGYSQQEIDHDQVFSIDSPTAHSDAIKTRRAVWLGTPAVFDERYLQLLPSRTTAAHAAWAAIPLVVEDRVLGSLGISFEQPREFDMDDRAFMSTIAQHCAQAIERARLYEEVHASAETLKRNVAERTKELQRALVQAQSADRAKSALLANVSHEMRTPLSSIIGFSNLLLSRRPTPEKYHEYLSAINAEARRLADLVDDFLDLQRLESGREVLRYAPLNLPDLIRDIAEKQVISGDDSRHIQLDLEPTPPVYADPHRIRQVILNLVSNAVKFSPPDGDIQLSLGQQGSEVVFSIRDKGLGIPQDELEHLFERFHRGDEAERLRIRGTGLGLALCREIIQAHHGRIWAESAGPSHGATFSFALPIEQNGSFLHKPRLSPDI